MKYKKCLKCLEKKLTTAFYGSGKYNSQGEEYLSRICKKCKYSYRVNRRKERKTWMDKIKLELECTKCGYSKKTHPSFTTKALEFHHAQNNKLFAIGDAVHKGYAKEKIMKEMKKCVVLCTRCHTEIHFN
tara:strand:- start:56 stop:445 length:390 start_codon:yes stop_codon:yes gene_type:complete